MQKLDPKHGEGYDWNVWCKPGECVLAALVLNIDKKEVRIVGYKSLANFLNTTYKVKYCTEYDEEYSI